MASRLLALARQGTACAALAYTAYAASEQLQQQQLSNLLVPVAYADAATSATKSTVMAKKVSVEVTTPKAASIALSGFEGVVDNVTFVSTVVRKALRYSKDGSVKKFEAGQSSFGEEQPVDTAAFYSFIERQPVSEKVAIIDDVVDSVVREAERSAEVEGLTVGMLGAGTACYALAGWWADMALPGAGTIGCTIAAGVSGHNRAKKASKRTRSRLLNAILDSRAGDKTPNVFVQYLEAPTVDAKQRIASEAKPAVFFNDFYNAVKPILKQASPQGADVLEVAA